VCVCAGAMRATVHATLRSHTAFEIALQEMSLRQSAVYHGLQLATAVLFIVFATNGAGLVLQQAMQLATATITAPATATTSSSVLSDGGSAGGAVDGVDAQLLVGGPSLPTVQSSASTAAAAGGERGYAADGDDYCGSNGPAAQDHTDVPPAGAAAGRAAIDAVDGSEDTASARATSGGGSVFSPRLEVAVGLLLMLLRVVRRTALGNAAAGPATVRMALVNEAVLTPALGLTYDVHSGKVLVLKQLALRDGRSGSAVTD
jgi:hypothetical protein